MALLEKSPRRKPWEKIMPGVMLRRSGNGVGVSVLSCQRAAERIGLVLCEMVLKIWTLMMWCMRIFCFKMKMKILDGVIPS